MNIYLYIMFFDDVKRITTNKIHNENINKKFNKEYCSEIEKILKFFRNDENEKYNDDKNLYIFKNLNIIYKNYYHFKILKEHYNECKKL